MMSRWHNLPLRLRLTIVYTGMVAVLLIALGGVLYLETRAFLDTSTAIRLRAQSKPVIDRWLGTESGATNGAPDAAATDALLRQIAPNLSRELTSRDTTAVILDRNGSFLADGRRLPEEPAPASVTANQIARALAGDNEVTYTQTHLGQRNLVLLIPLRTSSQSEDIVGVVQLNTPLTLTDELLWRQRTWTAAGIVITLLVAMAGGLWLTSSALAPLQRLIVTCRNIASGDLSQRANLPQHADEVGQLGAAFDDMAERIQTNFAMQRRFIAAAAHELRTPLTAIEGSLEVLLRGSQDDPAADNALKRAMYREVARLNRLSEQLLDLTRLESPVGLRLELLDLSVFMEEFAQQAQLLARGRRIALEPGERLILSVDRDALEQALVNLLDNAVQHTEDSGVIQIGWRRDGNRVALAISDDGEGISEEDLDHIFEPFFRGDRSRSRRRGGSGLGLAVVEAIVMAHDGAIHVSSQLGVGTCLTLSLPLAGPSATRSGSANNRDQRPPPDSPDPAPAEPKLIRR